jgi:hypothetical protein
MVLKGFLGHLFFQRTLFAERTILLGCNRPHSACATIFECSWESLCMSSHRLVIAPVTRMFGSCLDCLCSLCR